MITKPKGTYDIYGKDAILLENISDIIKNYMSLYNVDYIRTPIFESTDLFKRSVGETTDIVSKETYDFTDRGDRSLTLRPEGTASVARSLIENKFYGNRSDILKYFYIGTMYRYERPQSGRNREFTQFGIEVYNSNSIKVDAEVISLGYNLINEFGIDDVTVKINSLGDKDSREAYTKALKDYLKPYLNDLCEDCKKRFDKNPLRILDCKVDKDSEIFKDIPKIVDYLSEDSKNRFKELQNILMMLDVNYEVDNSIMRGLDYYTEVVYEYVNELGVTLCAGGRYNNLVESLGGPSVPATGFAMGLERILIELNKKYENIKDKNDVEVYVMAVSEEEKLQALKISTILRMNGIVTENCMNEIGLKSQFKLADNVNSKYLIILKDEDLQKGLINIKNNLTKEEEKIDETEVVEYLLTNL